MKKLRYTSSLTNVEKLKCPLPGEGSSDGDDSEIKEFLLYSVYGWAR